MIMILHSTKAQRAQYKIDWMNAFNDEVCRLSPIATGKIDWNSATYYFNSGIAATDAALKYVAIRSESGEI